MMKYTYKRAAVGVMMAMATAIIARFVPIVLFNIIMIVLSGILIYLLYYYFN